MRLRRREILAAGVVAALSGCADGGGSNDPTPATGTPTDPTGVETDHSTVTTDPTEGKTGSSPGTTGLDLREANVTAVDLDRREGRTFDVAVTMIHDDDGEDGYANWWQVATLDGERLGRRDLAHPHGTRAFTRSDRMTVPEGITCVVVRAHDETHGYGGQALLVDVASGATATRRQGADPAAFSAADCP
jgi:hypothetical protein